MMALAEEGRARACIVLENVYGALTSHGGKDFAAIATALAEGGYRLGALVVDAWQLPAVITTAAIRYRGA